MIQSRNININRAHNFNNYFVNIGKNLASKITTDKELQHKTLEKIIIDFPYPN